MASSNTVNQVRAVKDVPLIYSPPTDEWFVVPADAIVALVAEKDRGQHTENPFESATMSLNRVRRCADPYACDPKNLTEQTCAAIKASAGYPDVRAAMQGVLLAATEVTRDPRATVAAILAEHAIRP